MVKGISKQIRDRFLELNVDIESYEIEQRLRDLTERFKVPIPEAQRSVVNYYLRGYNVKLDDYYDTTQTVSPVQMVEESKICEILNKVDSLYTDFENTFEYIKAYNDKHNMTESYSVEILNSEKSKSHKTLLVNLAAENFDETNDIITELNEKLEKLRKLTLSEITHRKSKEIEFQIDSPFFFRKLRRDYRTLINELAKLDRTATKSDTTNIDDFVSKFESVIERLEDFGYEIEDEKKSGLYNSIGKSAFWGIPILIGLYQLIAMQYLTLNPYLPLVAYIIALSTIYLFLKSVTWIKFLYIGFKINKSLLSSIFILILVMVLFVYGSMLGNAKMDLTFVAPVTFLISSVVTLVYLSTKQIVERIKNDLIRNELDDLAVEYGIKE